MPEAIIPLSMDWKVTFDAYDRPERSFKEIWDENGEKYPVVARVVDTTVNNNRWAIPENEIDSIVAQLTEKQLRINHSKKDVMDVMGPIEAAHRETFEGNPSIVIKTWVLNEYVARLVHNRAITDLSISADPKDVVCSKCLVSVKSKKLCKDAHNLLKGVTIKEVSLVTEGAYPNAKILPATFSASVEEYITDYGNEFNHNGKNMEARNMPDDEKEKKKDEEDAQDKDDGMDKEVKALKAELAKYKAKCKAMEDEDEKKKEEAKKAALKSETTDLQAQIAEMKAKLEANEQPLTGETITGQADTVEGPKGTVDALMEEYKKFFEAQGKDMSHWEA